MFICGAILGNQQFLETHQPGFHPDITSTAPVKTSHFYLGCTKAK